MAFPLQLANLFNSSKFLSTTYPLPFITIVLSIIALIIFASRRSSKNASNIPLYAPEPTEKGNYKKRWIFDSVGLLGDAYRKVSELDDWLIHRLSDVHLDGMV